MNNLLIGFMPALWVESKKATRSKTFWITILAMVLVTAIAGLFMFILKDPEQAKRLGILGAKAQIFGSAADWPSFFNLMLILMSVGGLIIFGFIFTWIFGREFSEKTVYDILSLPISRMSIVLAKIITAACWSIGLIVLVFILMLGIGAALGLPGWSAVVVWHGLGLLLATGAMTVFLCLPFSLAASITRGYLPAVGCIFLIMILEQVITQLGNGQYFPWAVPLLYSGAAEAISGKAADPLGFVSYTLVILVGIISLYFILAWWRSADQT
jgi:ABC-2 type transport system permease protein